jgi:hypothetical protein
MPTEKEVKAWLRGMSGERKDKLKLGFIKEHEDEYNAYVERKYSELNSN